MPKAASNRGEERAIPMTPTQRLADPHEDDLRVERIEINFAIPVFIPSGALQELDALLSAIVKLKANQLAGHVHWVSGYGSKPNWSQADARFLGLPADPDAPATGEPTFDDTVYHVETTCREQHPSEKAKAAEAGA